MSYCPSCPVAPVVVKVALVGLVMVECRLSGGYCYSRDLLENLVVELVVLVLGEYLLGMDDIVRRSCSEITK